MLQAAIQNKGPKAVVMSKIKAHITQEMVDKGEVRDKDKKGSDASDLTADRGVDAHWVLRDLVRIFGRRNEMYVEFMNDVQTFIIKVKKVETEERKRREKQACPFGSQNNMKIPVANSLCYESHGESSEIEIRMQRACEFH